MASFGAKVPDFDSVHQSPKTLRDETIEVGNNKYDCWVVENKIGDFSMALPGRYTTRIKMKDFQITTWIDKKLVIEVRQDAGMKMDMAGIASIAMYVITAKKDLKVDEAVDESKFANINGSLRVVYRSVAHPYQPEAAISVEGSDN